MSRPTKREIIDRIIAAATESRFTGDNRDGGTPPITLENFELERVRYGTRALRARISRLSYSKLLGEHKVAFEYIAVQRENLARGYALLARFEQDEKDGELRALSQRQRAIAQISRLQPEILAAAGYYRARGMNAKDAWDAIRKTPFKADQGKTEVIE